MIYGREPVRPKLSGSHASLSHADAVTQASAQLTICEVSGEGLNTWQFASFFQPTKPLIGWNVPSKARTRYDAHARRTGERSWSKLFESLGGGAHDVMF